MPNTILLHGRRVEVYGITNRFLHEGCATSNNGEEVALLLVLAARELGKLVK